MGDSETNVILFTVLYAITMIVSWVGNTGLIYIVWKKPEVRSLTSFMFVNMAVADLLVTLVMMPYSIAFLYTEANWPIKGAFGDFTCRAVMFSTYVTVMASILSLTFIAVDRFYAIILPCRRRVWFRKAKILTPLIWLLSMVLMSIIPVTYRLSRAGIYCGLNFEIWGDEAAGIRGVLLYLFAIAYLIPLCVITILYVKTIQKLWFHQKDGENTVQAQRRQRLRNRKVVRALVMVVVIFALCWLPTHAYHIFLAITEWGNAPLLAIYFCYWFGHANSAINPWLYISFNRQMTGAM